MGLLGRVIAFSSGEIKAIQCLTCGDTYRSNISKEFPYAICGTCLENAQDNAQRNQDKQLFFEIDREFSRRCDLSGIKYQPKTFYVSGSDCSHSPNANTSKSSKGKFIFGGLAVGVIFLIIVISNSERHNSNNSNENSSSSTLNSNFSSKDNNGSNATVVNSNYQSNTSNTSVSDNSQAQLQQDANQGRLDDKQLQIDSLIYTDSQTGLQWLRDGNYANQELNWYKATEWVKSLNIGGYHDWRLPTKDELVFFSQKGGNNPSIWFTNNGFQNIQTTEHYWSSSSSELGAWSVSMSDGYVGNGGKGLYDGYVWPVRGGR